jgi:hypothetical protein
MPGRPRAGDAAGSPDTYMLERPVNKEILLAAALAYVYRLQSGHWMQRNRRCLTEVATRLRDALSLSSEG